MHLYRQGFRYGHYGYAAAIAYVMFAVVAVLTAIQLRFFRENT